MANNVVADPQPVTLEDAGGTATGTAGAPLRVDPTGTTTQPVSASTLPLPTGAATAANQQTDALTDAQLRAASVLVDVDDELVTPGTLTTSTIGTNTVVTPTAGKALRVFWFYVAAKPTNGSSVDIGFRWTTGGTDFYTAPLSQYGGVFTHAPKGGKGYVEGAADEALVINLSAAMSVHVNIDYEEFTP